jgi:transcriptional regulator with GAF, ATPase, and Fis domain
MMEKESNLSKKADEFLQIFKRGEEFTKDLIKENERLRFRIAQLEESLSNAGSEGKIRLYEDRIKMLEEEISSLIERYKKTEEENKDFATRYVDIEAQNNMLANLYVASYQLHSTLDFNEVLRIVTEIIINLIGAEEFAIFLMDDKMNELIPVTSEGLPSGELLPKVKMGAGVIGKVAKEGESFFRENLTAPAAFDPSTPIVCIPLKIKEHVIGVISIYSLFEQKTSFSNIDYELFNLLAGHAATAVFSSRLYTQSERKLTTIQSFLDLLKEKPKR